MHRSLSFLLFHILLNTPISKVSNVRQVNTQINNNTLWGGLCVEEGELRVEERVGILNERWKVSVVRADIHTHNSTIFVCVPGVSDTRFYANASVLVCIGNVLISC